MTTDLTTKKQNSHGDKLDELLIDLYLKFKLTYYQRVLKNFQSRTSSLSADEAYSAEAIYALGNPTVSDFANFMQISPQSAAYKVASLVKKGYVTKTQSADDRREYRLQVTDHYMDYYLVANSYVLDVVERVRNAFDANDIDKLESILQKIVNDLTSEISNKLPNIDALLTYRDKKASASE